MAAVDDIVDVAVTIKDVSPTRPSFGIPLLIGYHTAWAGDFVRSYETTDEMLDDGFTTDDALYAAATTLLSQETSPTSFMIGRRVAALTQTFTLTVTNTTAGFVQFGTIAGQTFSRENPGAETATQIATALTAIINPFTRVSATSGSAVITVVASTPGDTVDYSIGPEITVTETTADTTTDDTLAAIDDQLDGQDTSWYGLTVVDSHSKATALLAAAYVEARTKIGVLQSGDDGCGDPNSTTDTMAALQAASYTRTGCFYHRDVAGTEWLAAGILGGRLAVDPGAETWAYRPVAGVTIDRLKSAVKGAIEAKNGNMYVRSHATNISWEGKAASGRYLDVTRFVDWQNSTIDFDMFTELATPPKEPYTARGISQLKLTLETSIQKGVDAGGIADDTPIVVTAPKISETSTADRAARIVRNFTFTYRLSGAIHRAVVRGTVGV